MREINGFLVRRPREPGSVGTTLGQEGRQGILPLSHSPTTAQREGVEANGRGGGGYRGGLTGRWVEVTPNFQRPNKIHFEGVISWG